MNPSPQPRRITTDAWIILGVAMIWLAIAVIYRVVPLINMPPGERVWGASAFVFLGLAFLIYLAERRTASS